MPDPTWLALDIGTHTVLAAVARADAGRLRLVDHRQWFARLGEGVRSSGVLRPEAIARGLNALVEARALADRHGARIAAVATRACREARNADEFLRPARAALGVEVEVVSGEREAELTFRGAASDLGLQGHAVWADVGGGSTELIVADGPRPERAVSTPLGAVALTEAWLHGDPYTAGELAAVRGEVRRQLAPLGLPRVPTVVGIGGTATTLVAVERGLSAYDGALVHGFRLARPALAARIEVLAGLTLERRSRVTGLAPERAPVIVAGALVLDELLATAGAGTLMVSDRGVRHGVLLDRLGLRD
ncbi:MAG: Ppx/GppA family phosphatase [Deltaproteobacteria bacterium]|nr:Ppx/GppA family phosphatase [Deltaproteobacteria bacterium]